MGPLTQHLGNPQQQAHSAGTDESLLPSTFHSDAISNQHVPMAPILSNRVWPEENQS